jgi:cobalamin biosynthesis protein CobD/CbiB
MAGLLRAQLTKAGHYTLGDAEVALDQHHIDRAWRIVHVASWLGVAIAALCFGVTHGIR